MIEDYKDLSRNMSNGVGSDSMGSRKRLAETAEFSKYKTSSTSKISISHLYDQSDKFFLQQQSFKNKKKSNQYMLPIHTKHDR